MRDGDDAKYRDTKNRLLFWKKSLKSLHVRVFILGIRSQLIKLNLLRLIRTKNMHPFGNATLWYFYMMPSGHAILRGVEHKKKKMYKSYHFTLFFVNTFFLKLTCKSTQSGKKYLKSFLFLFMRHQSSGTQTYTHWRMMSYREDFKFLKK